MRSKEDFDSEIQQVVERVYEDEMLRADLTDEEAQPVLDWASNYLYQRLENKYSNATSDTELEGAPDYEYGLVKQVVLAIIALSNPLLNESEAPQHAIMFSAVRTLAQSIGGLLGNKKLESVGEPATSEGKSEVSDKELDPHQTTLFNLGLSPATVRNLPRQLAGKNRQEKIDLLMSLLQTVN
ncbi:MAG: hypothetical protein HXX08_19500 [Chloroflexi bacterium]|uniref:Uncharacterized protein n=1 Tax=Candidatus Chlorohelix allophototropha TaxID=3003348 RepID=A0A8T7M7P6_9CHLR|nr:hypothetical protein [Chloroflexota bacterium]WJW67987.1 hypothetical protein OZ401_003582 [Chloroflexota bacterium L227-S17]